MRGEPPPAEGVARLTQSALARNVLYVALADVPSTVSADPALTSLIQRIGQSEMSRSPEQADALGLAQEAGLGWPEGTCWRRDGSYLI